MVTWLIGFSTMKSLFFLFSYYTLRREGAMCSPYLRREALWFTSLSVEYLHTLCGIPLHGRFVFPPHLFIYAIIYLSLYVLLGIYCILWVIIKYYSAVTQNVLYLIKTSFIWLLCSFDIPHTFSFQCFLTFCHSKTLQVYLMYFLSQF